MTEERLDGQELFEQHISADIKFGTCTTFDAVVQRLQKKSGAEDDIFAIADSDFVQVDIGVGSPKIHRLSLLRHQNEHGPVRHLDMWTVNTEGLPMGDSYSYIHFSDGQKTITNIYGSSAGSLDGGDLDISPDQLASGLDALDKVNEFNWRVVVGNIKPFGKV